MKYQTISLKQFYPAKGAIYYVAIATVIFSHVKITCYFHLWSYHVFARKLTSYFIGVYIINYFPFFTLNIIACHYLLFLWQAIALALSFSFVVLQSLIDVILLMTTYSSTRESRFAKTASGNSRILFDDKSL